MFVNWLRVSDYSTIICPWQSLRSELTMAMDSYQLSSPRHQHPQNQHHVYYLQLILNLSLIEENV